MARFTRTILISRFRPWRAAALALAASAVAPGLAAAQAVQLQCEVLRIERGEWASGRSFGPNEERSTYMVKIDPEAGKAALLYSDGSGSWTDLSISDTQYSFCQFECTNGEGPIRISRVDGSFNQATRTGPSSVSRWVTITQTGSCARYEGPMF